MLSGAGVVDVFGTRTVRFRCTLCDNAHGHPPLVLMHQHRATAVPVTTLAVGDWKAGCLFVGESPQEVVVGTHDSDGSLLQEIGAPPTLNCPKPYHGDHVALRECHIHAPQPVDSHGCDPRAGLQSQDRPIDACRFGVGACPSYDFMALLCIFAVKPAPAERDHVLGPRVDAVPGRHDMPRGDEEASAL
jgi:hypothetical protein